jgi:hypothetical protein
MATLQEGQLSDAEYVRDSDTAVNKSHFLPLPNNLPSHKSILHHQRICTVTWTVRGSPGNKLFSLSLQQSLAHHKRHSQCKYLLRLSGTQKIRVNGVLSMCFMIVLCAWNIPVAEEGHTVNVATISPKFLLVKYSFLKLS